MEDFEGRRTTGDCKALYNAEAQRVMLSRCNDGFLTMCALPWLRQWTHCWHIHSRQPALKLRRAALHEHLQPASWGAWAMA